MLLRRLTAAFCPLLLCAVVCILFRKLDIWMGSGAFWNFVFKGVLLGAAIALGLPSAGIHVHTNGVIKWLFLGAGVLLVFVFLQYLNSIHVLSGTWLSSVLAVNGQVLLVEGAFLGNLFLTAFLYRKR